MYILMYCMYCVYIRIYIYIYAVYNSRFVVKIGYSNWTIQWFYWVYWRWLSISASHYPDWGEKQYTTVLIEFNLLMVCNQTMWTKMATVQPQQLIQRSLNTKNIIQKAIMLKPWGKTTKIKGPDNPTCQLLPTSSKRKVKIAWGKQEREKRWWRIGAEQVVCGRLSMSDWFPAR